MLRRILVPVDGSLLSERALIFAETFVRRTGADVILLEIVPPAKPDESERTDQRSTGPPSPTAYPVTHSLSDSPIWGETSREGGVWSNEQTRARQYLESLRGRHPALSAAKLDVLAGDPAEQILQVIEERQIDLVVMSTHGRSGLGRWIYGSVADAVMRQATVPVLLVTPDCRLTWPEDHPPHLLVPLDGSDVSERAVQPAADLAEALGGTIVLLQVVEPYPMVYAEPTSWAMLDPTPSLDAARGYLDDVARLLRSRGHAVKIVVGFGFTLSWLDRVVREEDINLTVMSSHGSSGIKRLILGSVATGAIQYATVPIVIVGPAMVARATPSVVASQSLNRP